ncbi:MAG: protoheme IX farnesyltransferase [Mangrovibacterium sp.]
MSRQRITYYLKIIFELGKVRISFPVALSALTGYALETGEIGATGLLLTLGVFLISCSSGTINHVQERHIDSLMPRTKSRPLPSGKINLQFAVMVIAGYFIAGSLVLLTFVPIVAWIVSVLTLLSYNAFYTPLKKVTAFAVVPGSLVGALPPYIGWLAAGGPIADPTIFWVAAFFFIGQIPHFWLLLLMFGNEYKLAGYPSLNDIFTENQIKRLSFTWILATIASAMIIALHVVIGQTVMFLLIFYILYLLFSLSIQLLVKKDFQVRSAFFKLNFLYLFMMIALVTDSLFHR